MDCTCALQTNSIKNKRFGDNTDRIRRHTQKSCVTWLIIFLAKPKNSFPDRIHVEKIHDVTRFHPPTSSGHAGKVEQIVLLLEGRLVSSEVLADGTTAKT